jgi:hypothetical protein
MSRPLTISSAELLANEVSDGEISPELREKDRALCGIFGEDGASVSNPAWTRGESVEGERRLRALSSSQRAGFSNLQTESMNQAAIAYEGHYPEAQVDDLAFCKMLAQDIEGLLRRLPMIACKYLGETNRRLFLRGQLAAFKMS